MSFNPLLHSTHNPQPSTRKPQLTTHNPHPSLPRKILMEIRNRFNAFVEIEQVVLWMLPDSL